MNILFPCIILLCAAVLAVVAPQNFLAALLDGATKSASLCVALLASYAVWLGLMRVWEESGVSKKISKHLRPIVKKLFRLPDPKDEKAVDAVCMNLSVNLLGIAGAATPYGIQAANLLDKTNHADFSSCMLFVINATSIQLIPTSIIGIRTALGSAAPTDILLPTLITTTFSTLFAVGLLWLCFTPVSIPKIRKTQGAGIR